MDVHLKQTLVLLGNIKTQITEFVQNPPFGFPKKYLESIQNSFSLSEWICRVLNSHDKRIDELNELKKVHAKQIIELQREVSAIKLAVKAQLEATALDAVAEAEAANDE